MIADTKVIPPRRIAALTMILYQTRSEITLLGEAGRDITVRIPQTVATKLGNNPINKFKRKGIRSWIENSAAKHAI
jgi:hypothetical protein